MQLILQNSLRSHFKKYTMMMNLYRMFSKMMMQNLYRK